MQTINSGDDDWSRQNSRRRGGGGGRCMTLLSREESGRGLECARGVECYSPARVAVCRLLAVVKRCKGRKKDNFQVKEVEKREVVSELSSEDGCRRNDGVSGHQRQEMTFNMAAGLGLLSLIAASKTELDKTAELRRQMEVFLLSAKEGHNSKRRTTPKQSEPECSYAVSTTIDGLSNLSPYSQEDHPPTSSQEESGVSFVCDKHCDVYESEGGLEGVNRLEEELEAELERLQLDIDTEEYVETAEVSENLDEVTEISSNDVSSGEVINHNEAVTPEHSGVPPLELERRLHELLETRQEERIKELEAHLEFMKEKLQEKEVEVIWWKDTAKLISKQVPESSRAKVVCDD